MFVDQVDAKRVIIGDAEVEFRQDIKKVLELNDLVVILLRKGKLDESGSFYSRNILAYDGKGEPVWRVEDAGISVRNREGNYIPQPYLSLWTGKDGKSLHAGLGGIEVEIDPSNGMLVKMEEHRW